MNILRLTQSDEYIAVTFYWKTWGEIHCRPLSNIFALVKTFQVKSSHVLTFKGLKSFSDSRTGLSRGSVPILYRYVLGELRKIHHHPPLVSCYKCYIPDILQNEEERLSCLHPPQREYPSALLTSEPPRCENLW